MRISVKSEYAILALMDLSIAHNQNQMRSLELIAKEQDIPRPFLVQILLELKKNGIVDSRRGARGGYWLAMPPSQVTVGDILKIIEGPFIPTRCNEAIYRKNACIVKRACVLRPLWSHVRDAIEGVVSHVTLEDLAKQYPFMTT
jgi:Rrf2 family transcriptional regulator, cysteine metabolism repressor